VRLRRRLGDLGKITEKAQPERYIHLNQAVSVLMKSSRAVKMIKARATNQEVQRVIPLSFVNSDQADFQVALEAPNAVGKAYKVRDQSDLTKRIIDDLEDGLPKCPHHLKLFCCRNKDQPSQFKPNLCGDRA
jgi:hypothetical protein